MDSKTRARTERVLRAMNVIPPFHDDGENAEQDMEAIQQLQASFTSGTEEAPANAMSPGDDASQASLSEHDRDIPTFDLGEKILAEQRRMTSRTRKGPGQAEPRAQLEVSPAPNALTVEAQLEPELAIEAASDEVAELQAIVADIVARDIERLCKGLKRPACSPS